MSRRPREIELTEQSGVCRGNFQAMGSPCELLVESADEALSKMLVDAVATEAWRIEDKYSRYIRDNIIDQINTGEGLAIEVDEETANLIDFSASLYEISRGAFDITSGVLREAWSFDGSDNVPTRSRVDNILPRVGWEKVRWQSPVIHLPGGMQIDLGGIGKEYAVDKALEIALKLTKQPCLINFGGDIRASPSSANIGGWQVGVESLASTQSAQHVIRLKQGGLATSGDSHRYLLKGGIRYSHVLNPRTGWPIPDAPNSITVAADTCTQAGMFATLAMLRGADAETFLEQEGVQYWCYR